MPTRDKASQPKAARKGAKKAARATKKPAAKKTAKPSAKAPAKPAPSDRCAALTQKGTACRLKPQEGSTFCARHQDAAPPASAPEVPPAMAPVTAAARNGKKTERSRRSAQTRLEPTPVEAADAASATATPDTDGVADKQQDADTDADVEDIPVDSELYGSEWSSTLEASPWDDVTPQMAQGEDDVELVDESEMGHDARRRGGRPPHQRGRPQSAPQRPAQPPQPLMTREAAEAKAREKLGPPPEIAPEEDLNEELATYERNFEAEVRRAMGLQRGRGRRGGRRRRGRGPGQGEPQHGGGGQQGQQARKRRGRRGGRGRRSGGPPGEESPRRARPVGRRGHAGGSSGGASGGPGRSKIARDSPLANRRPSSGPKGGVQPRRRRDPEV